MSRRNNKVLSEYKDKFITEARENNTTADKINTINTNEQTIYNPVLYGNTNYWVILTNS